MADKLPLFGEEEKVPLIGDLGKIYCPVPRKIRVRARPWEDSPKKKAKRIKVEPSDAPLQVEPSDAPLLCSGSDVVDKQKVKELVAGMEREYDKITFGLKIVRDHMGRMMNCIKELRSLSKAGDNLSL